jgi:Flp pilus assembly protein TadG
MKTKSGIRGLIKFFCFPASSSAVLRNNGQALVEFVLAFILLLAVAWVPADFGLAFYSGHLALNATREGARIGSADPNYSAQLGNCSLPACYSQPDGTILKETAKRLSSALLPGATIRVLALSGATCKQNVEVKVEGTYNYFFYRFLNYFGASVPPSVDITRSTQMRWEWQNPCT